jgi:hypothetical protein
VEPGAQLYRDALIFGSILVLELRLRRPDAPNVGAFLATRNAPPLPSERKPGRPGDRSNTLQETGDRETVTMDPQKKDVHVSYEVRRETPLLRRIPILL